MPRLSKSVMSVDLLLFEVEFVISAALVTFFFLGLVQSAKLMYQHTSTWEKHGSPLNAMPGSRRGLLHKF